MPGVVATSTSVSATAPVSAAPPASAAPPTTAESPTAIPEPPACEPLAAGASGAHPCSVQATIALPFEGSPLRFEDGSEGEVTWRGRLDSDARDDLVLVYHGTAGNWGEVLFSAYVGCGDERYAPVFGPDYALELVPTNSDATGYRRLRWVTRLASHDKPGTIATELRFDASGCYLPVGKARAGR